MARTQLFSLKSHDYMLDHRADEYIWEYVEFSVAISTNTGTAEVPTQLTEVLGIVNLCYTATLTGTNQTVRMITDGGITTGAVTVNVNTANLGNATYVMRAWLVGRIKLADLA